MDRRANALLALFMAGCADESGRAGEDLAVDSQAFGPSCIGATPVQVFDAHFSYVSPRTYSSAGCSAGQVVAAYDIGPCIPTGPSGAAGWGGASTAPLARVSVAWADEALSASNCSLASVSAYAYERQDGGSFVQRSFGTSSGQMVDGTCKAPEFVLDVRCGSAYRFAVQARQSSPSGYSATRKVFIGTGHYTQASQ